MCIKNNLKNCLYMFYDCKILPNITELENLNTENVSDFSYIRKLGTYQTVKSFLLCFMDAKIYQI